MAEVCVGLLSTSRALASSPRPVDSDSRSRPDPPQLLGSRHRACVGHIAGSSTRSHGGVTRTPQNGDTVGAGGSAVHVRSGGEPRSHVHMSFTGAKVAVYRRMDSLSGPLLRRKTTCASKPGIAAMRSSAARSNGRYTSSREWRRSWAPPADSVGEPQLPQCGGARCGDSTFLNQTAQICDGCALCIHTNKPLYSATVQ